MDQQLTDLIDSLTATSQHPTSWAWNAADDATSSGAYMDCSPNSTDLFSETFNLEVGDGYGDTITIEGIDVSELQEIHQKLTMHLAVIVRRRQIAWAQKP